MTERRPQTFALDRTTDVSGVSGTGRVADGCCWPDGTVSIRWRGRHPSIVHWADMAAVEDIHGHAGATTITWDTAQATTPTGKLAAALMDIAQGDIEGWDPHVMDQALRSAVAHIPGLLAERDRARDTAATLETELSRLDDLNIAAELTDGKVSLRASCDRTDCAWDLNVDDQGSYGIAGATGSHLARKHHEHTCPTPAPTT